MRLLYQFVISGLGTLRDRNLLGVSWDSVPSTKLI